MITILAKLCVIQFADFGYHCFKTLTDLIKSTAEMELIVLEILEIEVISAIKEQTFDVKRVSVKLLQGILELVEENDNTEMLAGLYAQCFP